MNIERQVSTKDQAKILKQLGVEQDEALFTWYDYDEEDALLCLTITGAIVFSRSKAPVHHASFYEGSYAAFTAGEIGGIVAYAADEKRYVVNHEMYDRHQLVGGELATLFNPQFLADCLIDIIVKQKLSVDEVNQRLIGEASPSSQNQNNDG